MRHSNSLIIRWVRLLMQRKIICNILSPYQHLWFKHAHSILYFHILKSPIPSLQIPNLFCVLNWNSTIVSLQDALLSFIRKRKHGSYQNNHYKKVSRTLKSVIVAFWVHRTRIDYADSRSRWKRPTCIENTFCWPNITIRSNRMSPTKSN